MEDEKKTTEQKEETKAEAKEAKVADASKDVSKNAPKTENKAAAPKQEKTAAPAKDAARGGARSDDKKRPFKRNERQRRPRRGKPRERKEFDQKIISIRRVTRVVAGGRRFSFSVAMVIGDRKGRVGVGVGKASDTALAIEKAIRDAKKNMITVKRTKEGSIQHDVKAKYCASDVSILPAKGRGVVAGSSVRNVLELGGISDVTAKIFSRSKNQLNNARAAIHALSELA